MTTIDELIEKLTSLGTFWLTEGQYGEIAETVGDEVTAEYARSANETADALAEASSALSSLQEQKRKLEEGVASIVEMTDPDNPESYRADDREGCLDTVQAVARALLSGGGEG